jgi:predicted nucleotide-binding protein
MFEHGFLIGKLGRSRVCSLVKGDVEKPNDISGVVYTSMAGGDWKIELAKELRAAEYPVDMNKVI